MGIISAMIILLFELLGYILPCAFICLNCLSHYHSDQLITTRTVDHAYCAWLMLHDLCFLSLKVDGYGIDSMAKIFLYFGYKPREELRFPAKKLRALWFAPPSTGYSENGTGVDGALPRIFISELLVDQLSYESQVESL